MSPTDLPALTADALTTAAPPKLEPVPLALGRLGVVVYVRRLNGLEYRNYLADLRKDKDGENADAVQLSYALGAPDGGRLYPRAAAVPLDKLTATEVRAIQHVFVEINLTDADELRGN